MSRRKGRKFTTIILKKDETCSECGGLISKGEEALKQVGKAQFFHRRCAFYSKELPQQGGSGQDIMEYGRRLPGSFESGKRR